MEIQHGIKHIAFIMDGNGRWAKKRMMPREYGHTFGAKKFKEIASHCYYIGVPYVTFYAFSTENWKRPANEVNAIMNLFMDYLDEAKKSLDKDVGIVFLGSKAPFSAEMRAKMEFLEQETIEHPKSFV
ncbi:MAG: di-trans,poly-cis-decaprenylcistransferase [Clostridia bacterium]|nr:di-trans,poly-cis-decaprenylcistransferase [Clostridia bacterium]